MRLATVAVILVLLGSASARAEWTPGTKLMWLLPQSDDDPAKLRFNIALGLFNHCTELGNEVPRNSPAEDKWVKEESLAAVNSGGLPRIDRVFNSPEYSRM